MAAIAFVAPDAFGVPGRNPLRSGVVTAFVTVLLVGGGIVLFVNRTHLLWLARRIREPFVRPLDDSDDFHRVADALASCPGPMRARFALMWIYVPVGIAVLAGAFAFSAAYFVIDAIIGSFAVGWGQGVLAGANVLLSLILFGVGAPRLATWRVAVSAHKTATSGYAT